MPIKSHREGILLHCQTDVFGRMTGSNGFEYPVNTVVILKRPISHVDVPSSDLIRVNIIPGEETSSPAGAMFNTNMVLFPIRADVILDEGTEERTEQAVNRLGRDIRRQIRKNYQMGGYSHMVTEISTSRVYEPEQPSKATIVVEFTVHFLEQLTRQ